MCMNKCIVLLAICWFGSCSVINGRHRHKIILPAYMDPPSASDPPNCWLWLQKIVGGKLPAKPKDIGTTFYLFTRHNPESGIKIRTSISKEARNSLRKKKKFVFITHGFRNNANEDWVKRMAYAFLEKEDANVLVVDWEKGAYTWNYFQAVSNTKVVGAVISGFLNYLHNRFQIPFSNFHLVGHSLGAQISSYVAHHINGTVGRLTALDPASHCFAFSEEDMRVDPSDAEFVDVIHTSGRDDILGLGLQKPVGDIDFYPNGGEEQPSCITKTKNGFLKWLLFPLHLFEAITCSHGIACDYFIESIKLKNCKFWGHKWDRASISSSDENCNNETCSPMGFDSEKFPARGVFYVPVKDGLPYCVEDHNADKRLLPWLHG